jgi:hypothetical protein
MALRAQRLFILSVKKTHLTFDNKPTLSSQPESKNDVIGGDVAKPQREDFLK